MDKFELGAVNLQRPDILICRIESRNRNNLSDNLSNASLTTTTVWSSKENDRLRGGVDIQ